MIGELKGEIGELRGQLREVIHNTNNIRQVLENQAHAAYILPELSREVAALDVRVTALEASENQRKGALTLGHMLFRSPVLGWLAGAAAILYAIAR